MTIYSTLKCSGEFETFRLTAMPSVWSTMIPQYLNNPGCNYVNCGILCNGENDNRVILLTMGNYNNLA